MKYYLMSFVCFAIAIVGNLSLDSKDWTPIVKISYYIIIGCAILFGITGIIYSFFH